MSRQGYRIRESYRDAMANQVRSDPSIGSSQRSHPSSSSLTDGSGERSLDNQSGPNINPSYQEDTNMVNHPSARPNAFPGPRLSYPERDLSIVVPRALVEFLRADGTQQFEERVIEQEQNGNVDMGLTEEEIMACIGYETFESVGLENKDASCGICQEDYVNGDEIGKLDCAHKFHIDCIRQWLVLNNICPICRRMALMPY